MRLAFVSLSLLTLNIRHKTLQGIYSLKFVPGDYKVVQVKKVSIHLFHEHVGMPGSYGLMRGRIENFK